jgi:hypothetical protein
MQCRFGERADHDENPERKMSTVFLSGSRTLSRLNDAIRARIKNMADNKLNVVIGDASGADKAMQCYLSGIAYPNVTVYCAGSHCRNNVGRWKTQLVSVDPKLRGRDFYAAKDRAMAAQADFGFVLWDGKSAGSIGNVIELTNRAKKVVLYFAPDREFYKLASESDLTALLARCDPETAGSIKRKAMSSRVDGGLPQDTLLNH